MTQENLDPTPLRAKLRAGAMSRLEAAGFDEAFGPWPLHGPLKSPRRMRAIVASVADAARDINPDWFIDSDEDRRTFTNAIMVMAGTDPSVVIPVRFSKRAVKVGRSTIPLNAPLAGELILTTVLDVVVAALPTN